MKKGKAQKKIVLLIILIIVILTVGIILIFQVSSHQEDKTEIITISTLEKIINVSELSTFTAVYNGIAQVMDEESPEEIDYYVSYEAKVNAGIDFEKVDITIDEDKTIHVDLPQVYITDVTVNISSLDYIFIDDSKNVSSVSQKSFAACEADARKESEHQDAIFELATQNAKNVLTALISPIVEQLDSEYTLVVE